MKNLDIKDLDVKGLEKSTDAAGALAGEHADAAWLSSPSCLGLDAGETMILQRSFRNNMGLTSYLLALDDRGEALLVDPTLDLVDVYDQALRELDCRLVGTLETGSVQLARKASVWLAGRWGCVNIVPCDLANDPKAVRVGNGDILRLGGLEIEVVGRLGKLNDRVAYRLADWVFLGTRSELEEPELMRLPLGIAICRSAPRSGGESDPDDARKRSRARSPSLSGERRIDGFGSEVPVRSDVAEFLQTLADEVRNPLASIRTFSEMLPENYDDPEFQEYFRHSMSRDIARLDGAVLRLQTLVDASSSVGKEEPLSSSLGYSTVV